MSGSGWLVVGILAGVYIVSVLLHPYGVCPRCKGTGRHKAWLRPWAHRPCHWCSGKGQRRTLGAVLLRRGDRRASTTRLAPKTPPRRR